jgi:NAD+ synthase
MIKDIDGLLEHVTICLRKRMDAAVVGLSGGADSTLVALLCVKALGKENVHAVHMPYNKLDSDTFNSKSVALAKHLGVNESTVWIDDPVNILAGSFGHLSEINQGNMRSRMRMITLYTTCCQVAERTGQQVRVIGTGNLSEDFIGYDTKGGDALCDYFPIGTLVKSEVYQLLEYFRDQSEITEEMINRIPSAGLWNGQTDEDELGYTYNEMEPYVLMGAKDGALSLHQLFDDPIAMFVYNRHIDNKHKHEAPPVIGLRGFCDS